MVFPFSINWISLFNVADALAPFICIWLVIFPPNAIDEPFNIVGWKLLPNVVVLIGVDAVPKLGWVKNCDDNAKVPPDAGVVILDKLFPTKLVIVLFNKWSVDDFVKVVEITLLFISIGVVAVSTWPTKFASTYLTTLPVALSAIKIKSLSATDDACVVFCLNAKLTLFCVVVPTCSISIASPFSSVLTNTLLVIVDEPVDPPEPNPFNVLIIYISTILLFL